MSDSYLQQLVVDRCNALGIDPAAEFFGVSPGLIKQWQAGSKSPSLAAVEQVFQPQQPSVTGVDSPWDGKQIFLAMPCYKSADPRTLFSILGIWDRAKYGASIKYGDAFLVHNRNNLMHDFLASGLPEVINIDDDMILPMGSARWFNWATNMGLPEKFAGMHTPSRLRSHGKNIVGALYFGRHPQGRAVYHEAMLTSDAGNQENVYAHSAPRDEIRPVTWSGTGCLWFKKEVLLDIQKTHPHLAPQHPTEPWHFFSNSDDALHKAFGELKLKIEAATAAVREQKGAEAERILVDANVQMADAHQLNLKNSRLQQGEDQIFGRRALAAGHQTYVDLGCVCGHAGGAVYGPHNTGK